MLVLADADRLGIDLDQLRQRILQPSGDGSRAPLPHVELRKLFCCQFAGAVYGRAGLVDDHVLDRLLFFFDELGDHLLGFSRRRAVAHADHGDVVPGHELMQFLLGLPDSVLGRRGIDHLGIEDSSRGVRHRQLAAGSEGGIPAQDHFARDRLLHQQLLQVGGEDADRAVLGFLRQLISEFSLDRRGDQAVIAVFHRRFDIRKSVRIGIGRSVGHLSLQIEENIFCGRLYFDCEEVLLLSAVDRQDSVPRDPAKRFLIIEVHLVDTAPLFELGGRLVLLLLCVLRLLLRLLRGHDGSLCLRLLADPGAEARLVGDLLGDDVHGAGYGRLRVRHFLLFTYIFLRLFLDITALFLRQNIVRQSLQSFLLCDTGARPSLGAIGEVQVLHFYQSLRGFDGRFQLLCELPLLLDALHDFGLALLQGPQISQRLAQFTELLIGERPRRFLSVSGDEGDRVSLIDQLHCRLHLPVLYAQFLGDRFNNLHNLLLYLKLLPSSYHNSRFPPLTFFCTAC